MMQKANKAFQALRRAFSSRTGTMVLAAGAAVLLAGGSVNGARAALTYYSDDYVARVSMENVGVSIIENGALLSWRNYSDGSDGSWDEHMGTLALSAAEPDEMIKIGKEYKEELSVLNSGGIDGYVRVVVHKYWADPDGTRRQDLKPEYIILGGLGESPNWVIDEKASTEERTVLYYMRPLPVGSETGAFLTSVSADSRLADLCIEDHMPNGKYDTVTTTFIYDGAEMGLDIEADIVQEHNISDAAWSAWGRKLDAAGGTLNLR